MPFISRFDLLRAGPGVMNGDAMKNATQRDERSKTRSFRAAFAARDRAEAVTKIAQEVLGLATLDTRSSDSLDFSEQAVWTLKAALEAAYAAGLASAKRK